MAHNFGKSHLCSVCWQHWVDGQAIYCSSECRRVASNFLNRTYFQRSNLGELGFTLKKSDGVFFTIDLPDNLIPLYPNFNKQICFPLPGLMVDCLSAKALMNVVEEYVGKPVADLIRGFSSETLHPVPDPRAWFTKRVTALYNHPAHSTFCPKCCVKRITTEAGWDPQHDCCTDCSIAAIPF